MKRAIKKMIEDKARDLLQDAKAGIPVDLDVIAAHLGVPIRHEFLNGDISGFLFRQDSQAAIVVNRRQSKTRRRFTIAHEIGHYLLDHKRDEIHVDRAFVLKFRKGMPAGDQDEIQANAFAAALLMPRDALTTDLLSYERNGVIDDTTIQTLADRYGVSIQALLIQLATIDLALTVAPN
ncbi:MAG TPA: ImmA/IrrE family metallo-endopeptidase [Candidatus Elarobacter sp.]|jgi:Zn-dependent peptidase ImmA (M78 family)